MHTTERNIKETVPIRDGQSVHWERGGQRERETERLGQRETNTHTELGR